MKPQRVQLSRAKGWRLPAKAVSVARPTKWGNPFRVGCGRDACLVREPGALTGQPWELEGRSSGDGNRHDYFHEGGRVTVCHVRLATAAECVELYRRALFKESDEAIRATWGDTWTLPGRGPVKITAATVRDELAGLDLACWCKPGEPCHADVLLAIANGEAS